jgi:hypothetical protein
MVLDTVTELCYNDLTMDKRRSLMKCPACGKNITTWKSMLGGKAASWHKPATTQTPTFANGQCLFSGTVLNEFRKSK